MHFLTTQGSHAGHAVLNWQCSPVRFFVFWVPPAIASAVLCSWHSQLTPFTFSLPFCSAEEGTLRIYARWEFCEVDLRSPGMVSGTTCWSLARFLRPGCYMQEPSCSP